MNKLKTVMGGLTAVVLSALPGCRISAQEDAVHAASAAGWSNVRVISEESSVDWDLGHVMIYLIEGKNPAGKQAQAEIHCPYTKTRGCTLRY